MPTAISQVKEHVKNKGNFHSIISTPLVNFYLKTHMIKTQTWLNLQEEWCTVFLKIMD